jgi:hypothetical protein
MESTVWYRRHKVMYPLVAVAGILIGCASAGGSDTGSEAAPQALASMSAPSAVTSTVTRTVAAPAVTKTPTRATTTRTVTRTVAARPQATAAPLARGGDSGGTAYYANCSAARAAGAAPLRQGEPGYRQGLDRDGDGVACE